MNKNIDYALVEETRPPVYTAMKYWGKKPHNIWSQYIETYVDVNGIVLDPFSGSALSGIEALKLGRKVINFDLNPLTTFLIDTFVSDFNHDLFKNEIDKIITSFHDDEVYNSHYKTKCRVCENLNAEIQHFKWNDNHIYEAGVECSVCKNKYIETETLVFNDISLRIEEIEIKYWIPIDKFNDTSIFTKAFIKNIKGNSFENIWTKRNLYVLSKIFDYITKEVPDHNLKKQLMFAFVQSLHLSSKMCIPRGKSANRDYSTSWGRPAFLCSKKQMEMNPLLLFRRNGIGKQSVESALNDFKKSVNREVRAININENNNIINHYLDFDILYGIVDAKNIASYLPEKSIDFIITDPPYGGLIKYFDLSQIWLVWLERFNEKYKTNFADEITIKSGFKSKEDYKNDFTRVLTNLYIVLKDEGKAVFTFHNKDLDIWNAFLNAVTESGFFIEKVIHQPNKRSGESNVKDSTGTSASDFYIRCVKKVQQIPKINEKDFSVYVIESVKKIINIRNEPTPFQVIFNVLLSEFSIFSQELINFDANIRNILYKRDDIFKLYTFYDNPEPTWWLLDNHIENKNEPLTFRLEIYIKELSKTNPEYTYDTVLGEVYKSFPNFLVPEVKQVKKIYKEYFKNG